MPRFRFLRHLLGDLVSLAANNCNMEDLPLPWSPTRSVSASNWKDCPFLKQRKFCLKVMLFSILGGFFCSFGFDHGCDRDVVCNDFLDCMEQGFAKRLGFAFEGGELAAEGKGRKLTVFSFQKANYFRDVFANQQGDLPGHMVEVSGGVCRFGDAPTLTILAVGFKDGGGVFKG